MVETRGIEPSYDSILKPQYPYITVVSYLFRCPFIMDTYYEGHQMDTTSYIPTETKGIKVHKSNKTYLLDFRIDGKRHRKQIPSMPIKEAITALNDFKSFIIKQSTIQVDLNSTVDEYWQIFRQTKRWKQYYEKEMNLYYEKNIKQHLGNLKIIEVKGRHFTALNTTLTHLSTRTQKKAYEILKPLFEQAIEDDLIEKNPIKKSHIPVRNGLSEKKIITNAEVKYRYLYQTFQNMFNSTMFYEKENYQSALNPHLLAIFLFGFHGRRVNEVLTLQWEDINMIMDTYVVRKESSKVNTDMTFKLPQDIRQALVNMSTERNGNVFNVSNKTIQRSYSTIRTLSGIPDFTFHWMRNLAVSALASSGVDTTHLSAMLGHQDSSTVKKYLSLQRTASTNVTNDATAKLLAWDEEE